MALMALDRINPDDLVPLYDEIVRTVIFTVKLSDRWRWPWINEKPIRQMRGSTKEKSLIDKYVGQINDISQELKKVNGRREHLFEGFSEGVLDEAIGSLSKNMMMRQRSRLERSDRFLFLLEKPTVFVIL